MSMEKMKTRCKRYVKRLLQYRFQSMILSGEEKDHCVEFGWKAANIESRV